MISLQISFLAFKREYLIKFWERFTLMNGYGFDFDFLLIHKQISLISFFERRISETFSATQLTVPKTFPFSSFYVISIFTHNLQFFPFFFWCFFFHE